MSPEFDAVKWLQTLLETRCFRIARINLTIRSFALRGIQYRCDDGPWRDTLYEAIQAHRARQVEGGGTHE